MASATASAPAGIFFPQPTGLIAGNRQLHLRTAKPAAWVMVPVLLAWSIAEIDWLAG